MNRPCKISVVSTRKLSALSALPQIDLQDVEEDWEEILLEEGIEPTAEPLPRDSFRNDLLEPEERDLSTTLTAYGILSKEEDGSVRVSYEDSEITGLQGCLTTFCFTATGMLILLRRGTVKTCMVFEHAHRHLCDYGAAEGIPSVVLHTHSLQSDLSEDGGEICVDYSVEIRGTLTEKNRLSLTVEPIGRSEALFENETKGAFDL